MHPAGKAPHVSSPQEPYQPGYPGPAQPQQATRRQPAVPPRPPQAPASPFGLPGQPPPRSRKKLWLVLAGVGGVVLLVILGVVILVNVVGSATNQAKGLADDFTQLVIAGDSSAAYDEYLDPALQEQVSKESFIAGIESLEMDGTCKPDYSDLAVTTENGVTSADVVGLIACDGKNINLAYTFKGTDGLKMTDISLRPAA